MTPKLTHARASFGQNLPRKCPKGACKAAKTGPKRVSFGLKLYTARPFGLHSAAKMGLLSPFWPKTPALATLWAARAYPPTPRVLGGSATPVFLQVKKWLCYGILFTRKKHKKLLTAYARIQKAGFQLRDYLRRSFSPKNPTAQRTFFALLSTA